MSRSEFIRHNQDSLRKSLQWMIAGFASFGIGLLGTALAAYFKDHGGPAWLGTLESALGIGGLCACFILILIGAIASGLGIPCAKCGKRLPSLHAQMAIATGKCCFCGEGAFDEVTGMDQKKKTH